MYIRMFYILKENNIKDQTDTFHLELLIKSPMALLNNGLTTVCRRL